LGSIRDQAYALLVAMSITSSQESGVLSQKSKVMSSTSLAALRMKHAQQEFGCWCYEAGAPPAARGRVRLNARAGRWTVVGGAM